MKILKEKVDPIVVKVDMDVAVDSKTKINLYYLCKLINYMYLQVYTLKLLYDNEEYRIDTYDIENESRDYKTFKSCLKEYQIINDQDSPRINLSRINYSWVINFYDRGDDTYDFTVKYDMKTKTIHVDGTICGEDYDYLKIALTTGILFKN